MDNSKYPVTLQTEGSQNYLAIDLPEDAKIIPYCRTMLENNTIPGILPMRHQMIDGRERFRFPIGGKVRLGDYCLAHPLTQQTGILLLKNLTASLQELEDYFLSASQCILDPEQVYVADGLQTYVMCLPVETDRSRVSNELKQFYQDLLSRYFTTGGSQYFFSVFMGVYNAANFDLASFTSRFLKDAGSPLAQAASQNQAGSLEHFDASRGTGHIASAPSPKPSPVPQPAPSAIPSHASAHSSEKDGSKGGFFRNRGGSAVKEAPAETAAESGGAADSSFAIPGKESIGPQGVMIPGGGTLPDVFGAEKKEPRKVTKEEKKQQKKEAVRQAKEEKERAKKAKKESGFHLFGGGKKRKEEHAPEAETPVQPSSLAMPGTMQEQRENAPVQHLNPSQQQQRTSENRPADFGEGTISIDVLNQEDDLTSFAGEGSGTAAFLEYKGKKVPITRSEFLIGQYSTNRQVDFAIYNNRKVSHQHAVIITNNGRCYLRDDRSTNGTWLNGIRLEHGKTVLLHDGDEIRLYDETLIFRMG